ncbi:hypothetical protein BGZ93_007104 [Podila epicladia]|nr:hypothetical protein BGZ93_007104 [Podila epicladia]
MSSFECHSAFLANIPSAEPSPANPKKKIHALPQPHPRDSNTNNSRSNHSSVMTTSTTTAPSAISASTSSSGGSRRNMLVKPSQSFADFFSASTPVPASVTLLLSYTSPAIHGFHRLLQLLTWTSDRSVKSFLVLFGWWALCLGTETFLIYGLHGALILYLGHMWIRSRKVSRMGGGAPQSPAPGTPLSGKFSFSSSGSSRSAFLTPTSARHPTSTQVEQAVTLKEIQEILDHWAAWNRSLDRLETYFDWSDRSTTRLVLALVVLTYVPWLIFTYLIPMRFILAVVGSIAICWRAPWFGILRAVAMKTDDHLEPTQSKSAFQLPPPHIAHEAIPGQPNKVLRKSQEWRWLDPHWRLKLGLDSDVDGWEYANNHWQKWSGKNRRGAYTRRRAWERTAKLIDQREIVLLEDIEDEVGSSGEVEEDESGEEEEVEEEEEEEEVHH